MVAVPVRYRFTRLGTDARLTIFASAAALGILLVAFFPEKWHWGLLCMALPLPLLSAHPWTNKPEDLGEEDWQPSGEAELDRIADAFRSARKLKIPFWYRRGSGIPWTILLALAALLGGGPLTPLGLVGLNGLVLLWPTLHFLRVKVWVPRNFEMVVGALQAARSVPAPPGISITPYLRLDRDATGLRIPEDGRLMVERRGSAEDLVGIQVQAAINNGPNGAVPYLYAVVLTQGRGASWRKAQAFRRKGYEVEPGGDDEYGTVVVRQATGGGGYHTGPKDCAKLMTMVYGILQTL